MSAGGATLGEAGAGSVAGANHPVFSKVRNNRYSEVGGCELQGLGTRIDSVWVQLLKLQCGKQHSIFAFI